MVNEKIRVTRPGGVVGIVVPWQNSVYNLIVRKAFGRHWPFGQRKPFRRAELATFMGDLGPERRQDPRHLRQCTDRNRPQRVLIMEQERQWPDTRAKIF